MRRQSDKAVPRRSPAVSALAAALCLPLAACGKHAVVDNTGATILSADLISALTCHLETGYSASIGDKYRRHYGGDSMELTFTNFDWDAGTATVIGNQGTATTSLVREAFADQVQFQFIERTPSGNLAVTSVFFTPADVPGVGPPPYVKTREASVVHSRHMLFGGIGEAGASVSQMVGTCQIKTP